MLAERSVPVRSFYPKPSAKYLPPEICMVLDEDDSAHRSATSGGNLGKCSRDLPTLVQEID